MGKTILRFVHAAVETIVCQIDNSSIAALQGVITDPNTKHSGLYELRLMTGWGWDGACSALCFCVSELCKVGQKLPETYQNIPPQFSSGFVLMSMRRAQARITSQARDPHGLLPVQDDRGPGFCR
jgi:hypothetical protein